LDKVAQSDAVLSSLFRFITAPEILSRKVAGQKSEAAITHDIRILAAQILHTLAEADTFSPSDEQLASLDPVVKELHTPTSLHRTLLQELTICMFVMIKSFHWSLLTFFKSHSNFFLAGSRLNLLALPPIFYR
jgi:hypothetical protein